jgi:hypothetical protein
VDRITGRERELVKLMEGRTPIVETYLQNCDTGRIPRGQSRKMTVTFCVEWILAKRSIGKTT